MSKSLLSDFLVELNTDYTANDISCDDDKYNVVVNLIETIESMCDIESMSIDADTENTVTSKPHGKVVVRMRNYKMQAIAERCEEKHWEVTISRFLIPPRRYEGVQ